MALNLIYKSFTDIGSDTAIYLEIGKKIALGGRYYYDYFESNLPFNFYLYALQYKIHQLTNLNRIFLAEIFIYFLFFLSLIFSLKILKKTTLSANKIASNFFIITFFIGFFLRTPALEINEFGTKTTFLLLLLFPYLIYSLEFKNPFTKKDLVYRGIIMALIPCFKPHYLIFLFVVEGYRFIKNPTFNFFIRLDILITTLIGLIALNWVIYFEREYFEFMVPMWRVIYPKEFNFFIIFKVLFDQLLIFFVIFFAKIKSVNICNNLKIISCFFIASFLLAVSEILGSIDQLSLFYFVLLLMVFFIIFDQGLSKILCFKKNIYLFLFLILGSLIFFNTLIDIVFISIFPLCFVIIFLPLYATLLTLQKRITPQIFILIASFELLTILFLKQNFIIQKFIFVNIFNKILILILFLCYEIYQTKTLKKKALSLPSMIILYYLIINPVHQFYYTAVKSFSKKIGYVDYSLSSKKIHFYSKKYAPTKQDKILFMSSITFKNPLGIYLKENDDYILNFAHYNYFYLGINKKNFQLNFNQSKSDEFFVDSFFLNHFVSKFNDRNYKILLIPDFNFINSKKGCSISYNEFLYRTSLYRKLINDNFVYVDSISPIVKNLFTTSFNFTSSGKVFDLQKNFNSTNQIIEIYVRKE